MAALPHPVGTTVMARHDRFRDGRPVFDMHRAVITGHVDGPDTVPGYTVRFPHGRTAYVTTTEVLPLVLDYPVDHHLTGVTLRAASRTGRVPARVSALLHESLSTARHVQGMPDSTIDLDILVRRATLGSVAYRLALMVETAQEETGRTDLEEHLEALNAIGVNHRANAQDLRQEALVVVACAQALLHMVKTDRSLAHLFATHLERNPR